MLAKVDRPVTITLDGEPRGKARPQFSSKTMRAFTPAKTRNYEAAMRMAAMAAMVGRTPLLGPLKVCVTARMSIPASWPRWKQRAAVNGEWMAVGRPDIDNIFKTLDAFNGIVWGDDSQIVDSSIVKVHALKPGVTIVVIPLPQATR